MTANAPVDEFTPPWTSFADFFRRRSDLQAPFLTELHHEHGRRQEWSVGQWRERIQATVEWLHAERVQPGDNVAALAGNTADALAVAYACWVHGACYLPLNPHDPADRQAFILQDAKAVLLVHGDDATERAEQITTGTGTKTRSTASLPSRPSTSAPEASPGPEPDLASPALRVYTSGTTGDPKGVVLTARNLLVDCDALAEALAWESGTRILTVLPVHHVNGLIISSLLPWYAELSTVLCDRFRSDRFWADMQSEQAHVCSVVPSLLEFLLSDRREPPACAREILCGAGPLLLDTVAEFEDSFGVPVRHLYGLSETTAVATLMPRLPDEQRRHWYSAFGFPSIGPAVPHVQVSVLDPAGRPCPEGVRGELVVRGATVMSGYAGRVDSTEEVIRDGWFHTGDEGFWQEGPEGVPFFFITGRMKELIIRGGANISPFQVDEVLRAHPAVRFGLAIPFENRFYGEEVAAYVVLDRPATEQEILEFCAERLDFALQPKVVIFGDDVPYTATGKAKRLTLKRHLAEELDRYRDVQFRRRSARGAAS